MVSQEYNGAFTHLSNLALNGCCYMISQEHNGASTHLSNLALNGCCYKGSVTSVTILYFCTMNILSLSSIN